MSIEEFEQLAARYGCTVKEIREGYWAFSADDKHYVPVGDPVTLSLSADEWHELFTSVVSDRQWRNEKQVKNGR